jgi:dephospho-CoA kinase
MSNYLIEGISGTGKTTVGEELQKRGFKVIDADQTFGFYGDPKTGLPTDDKHQLNWIWDSSKVKQELTALDGKPIFVCGGAMNQIDFTNYFASIFTLYVDDETLKNRLLSRSNNDFGKDPEDLARQLEWNKGTIAYANQRKTVLIDATKPIDEVVDEILNKIA